MSTLSVPLPAHLAEAIDRLVKEGHGANKADVVRRAIKRYTEEEAVYAVLRAEREAPLKGDLRKLMKKLR